MPVETPTQSRPRQDLLGAHYEFDPAERGLMAHEIFPEAPVAKRFGTYGIIPREAFLERVNTKRAPKATTSESSFSPESDDFALFEYAHKEFVDEVEAENYEDWFDAEEIASMRTAGIIALDYEIDVASLVFDDTAFPADGVTGTSETTPWDNANGTPLTTIEIAKQAIEDNYGVLANALIITSYGYRKFGLNPEVRGRLTDTYGREVPAVLPVETIRALTGLEKVIVVRGVYNSAKPGQAPVIAKIWNEDRAMVCRIGNSRDLKEPQLGRTLALKNQNGTAMDSWDIPDPKGRYIRARSHKRAKRMVTPVGYLIRNTKT